MTWNKTNCQKSRDSYSNFSSEMAFFGMRRDSGI